MCHTYPRLNSCCGVPVRIGLIFIAVLSIVTGAFINGTLKKTGFNIATIQEVITLKNLTESLFTKSTISTPRVAYWRHGASLYDKDIPHTEKIDRRNEALESDEILNDSKYSTIEIIGEDGVTEIIKFQASSEEQTHNETQIQNSSESKNETNEQDGQTTTDSEELVDITTTRPPVTTAITTTLSQKELFEERERKKDPVTRTMGVINRNGMNLLSFLFIALGVLCLVANFMNSPDIMMIYVMISMATCLTCFVLLFSVVAECTRARDSCLLRRLDWFSGFAVCVIWFANIFMWAFFTAVANTFANNEVAGTGISNAFDYD